MIQPYEAFAQKLNADGKTAQARTYRLGASGVLVRHASRLAEYKHKRDDLVLSTVAKADQVAGLNNLDVVERVSAYRDALIAFERTANFQSALDLVGSLFRMCHADGVAEDYCPLIAFKRPLFFDRDVLSVWEMPDNLRVDLLYFSVVLQKALASVSFEPETKQPRYSDGHDFIGAMKVDVDANGREHEYPYASVSIDEDRTEMYRMILNDEAITEAVSASLSKGQFELPVKVVLAELSYGISWPALEVPRFALDKRFAGFTLAELDARVQATGDRVPEATRSAFATARRAAALFREFATWRSFRTGGRSDRGCRA